MLVHPEAGRRGLGHIRIGKWMWALDYRSNSRLRGSVPAHGVWIVGWHFLCSFKLRYTRGIDGICLDLGDGVAALAKQHWPLVHRSGLTAL